VRAGQRSRRRAEGRRGPGHAFASTGFRCRETRGCDGPTDAHLQRQPRNEACRERAIEGVAGTGRIDGCGGRRRDGDGRRAGAVAGHHKHTRRTERRDDPEAWPVALRVRLEQGSRLPLRRLTRGTGSADANGFVGRECCELAAIRRQQIREPERRAIEATGRGGIEDRARPGGPGGLEGGPRGRRRNLVADEDDIVGPDGESGKSGGDVRRADSRIGARRHGDHVLARPVDQDQGDAGRGIRDAPQLGNADAFGREARGSRRTERILADRAHEFHDCAQPPRGHGLIRSLATLVLLERAAAHGLSRGRKVGNAHDEIDID
jgi:hypothetical protein